MKIKSWIIVLTGMLLTLGNSTAAQLINRLTLAQTQELAEANFPLIRQRELIRKTSGLTIENLRSSFLPQLNLSAQASYQSEVTEVPVKIQGFAPEPLSKDQYRALLDLSQLIYDGGSYTAQRKLQEWNDKVETEKLEVELQKLRENINQVYFSALLATEQAALVALVDKDLDAGMKRIEAQLENGTAYRSSLAVLKSEKIRNSQRSLEWQWTRRGLLNVLSQYTGKEIGDDIELVWPDIKAISKSDSIARSELTLIRYQDSLIQQRDQLVDVRNRPKLSAFVQGGYGRPALNMLKNAFGAFYTAGLRFNWGISSLYSSKRDRELLLVQRQVLTVQEENFLMQTRARLRQQGTEIDKWAAMLQSDLEIIGLKDQVRDATKAQLDNGVATASDYIRDVNAADQARLQQLLHKLQWIQATIQYETIAGREKY